MVKEKKSESILTISKSQSYSTHKIILEIDEERTNKFNKGETIEVSSEELKKIGQHRWLIIGEKDGRKDIIEN